MESNYPLILVVYVQIGHLESEDIHKFLKSMQEKVTEGLKPSEEFQYRTFIIPIREGDSRIECINPVQLKSDEYESVTSILDKMEKCLEEFMGKAD